MSQRRDLKIPLQMAFGRARDDFEKPRSGTGTITHFVCKSTICLYSKETWPTFHIFEKTQFPKKLEYSTSSERCATPWYIETCALRIYFYVRSVKLHFGEFSKLTFQAVSWSLLFSAPAACFMLPVGRPDIVTCGQRTLFLFDRADIV